MKGWLIGIIAILLATVFVGWKQLNSLEAKWKIAEGNVKAYNLLLSSSREKNAALELTVNQLEYFQDSVLKELNATRESLKIKDKNLKALQQVSSSFTRVDTITMRDTLFKEPSLVIDTIFGDEWYKAQLGLKYPSTIIIKPEFKSDKHIIVSSKKETVNPPKKFFLFRWFQKKHTIIHIDVIENNPYVINESSRYVEIIR